MKISTILARKERDVLTLRPEDTVQTAGTLLATNNIGALPVRDMHGNLIGILSERDIIRGIYRQGIEIMNQAVGDLMTRGVKTCTPDDDVKEVLEAMSVGHFRHMPVVENSRLIGMVSQGDVVKLRLEQSEMETGVMRDIAIAKC